MLSCFSRAVRAGRIIKDPEQYKRIALPVLHSVPFNYSQVCHFRDVDYFGFNISKNHLGETLKDQKIKRVKGYSNLKTRVHRLQVATPENLNMSKFAASTLTERKFSVNLPDEYTIEPLVKRQMAGRDPNTGRVAVHRRGGGIKKWFRWIDFNRLGPSEEEDLYEKVLWIDRDLCRTAYIALVANDVDKRYILAHDGMKVGDIIKSTRKIPKQFEPLKVGDAHPLGAMPVGTLLSQFEIYPRTGAMKCRAAGAVAEISEHMDNDMVLVKCLGKKDRREFILNKHCLAVVGRVSRYGPKREVIGSGQRARWMGIRPSSGWWKRKTGRFGRKIHTKKRTLLFDPSVPPAPRVSFPPLASRR